MSGRKRREGAEPEDFVNDSSDLGEYEGDEAVMAGRKKSKGRRRRERELSPGSDEDEAGPSAERKRRKGKLSERKRIEREMDEQVPARLRGKSILFHF